MGTAIPGLRRGKQAAVKHLKMQNTSKGFMVSEACARAGGYRPRRRARRVSSWFDPHPEPVEGRSQ
ncbi:hypothetical protein WNY37_02125 [Henriciella sp. AS95]|uniref:hypothetical protein n=1 Tax=Henriciella sp. AS95 TaxID=3135782 RepID=UPI00316E201B